VIFFSFTIICCIIVILTFILKLLWFWYYYYENYFIGIKKYLVHYVCDIIWSLINIIWCTIVVRYKICKCGLFLMSPSSSLKSISKWGRTPWSDDARKQERNERKWFNYGEGKVLSSEVMPTLKETTKGSSSLS